MHLDASGCITAAIRKRWKREKPRRHHLPLIIFDHSHRIPQATHLLQLCCQDVMNREAAYPLITPISALFIHLLPDPSYAQKFFCSWQFTEEWCFFFLSSSYTKSSVFTKRSRATTSHLVCCCIKLWHQPVLIVSRPGEGWLFFFIFRFLAQVSVAQHPAKADNKKRWMMSCRQSTICQTCDQVSRKLSLFPWCFFCFLFFSSLFFFMLFEVGKSRFFSLPDDARVQHPIKAVGV